MNDDGLTDRDITRLLATEFDQDQVDAVVRAVEQLRLEHSAGSPPVNAALAEFVGEHLATGAVPASAAGWIDPRSIPLTPNANHQSSWRTPMLTRLSAFVGTLTGKIVLGTGLALAAAGGASAAGVIDGNSGEDQGPTQIVTDDNAPPVPPVNEPTLAALLQSEPEANDLAAVDESTVDDTDDGTVDDTDDGTVDDTDGDADDTDDGTVDDTDDGDVDDTDDGTVDDTDDEADAGQPGDNGGQNDDADAGDDD